ncbi:MAG TPA: thermonuclease family protein [Candidatus Saccharimonadales bacterium]|nr:thermonuclease family protein [Candidatus Saccharimonadales bacterium]
MKSDPQNRRLWFWWLVFLALTAVAILAILQISKIKLPAAKVQPGLYDVTKFVDGDTISVNMNGTEETIRFIGVDTPETHRPETPVQCFGPQAADYTKSLIGRNKVRLEADPLNTNRDRYGRLLRYVYLPDNTLVEAQLIKNGYGFAYISFPFEKRDEFAGYETAAKNDNLGLWGNCKVTVQANGIEQTNPQN